MSVKLQITCIDKSDSQDPAHRISFIHGGGAEHRWTVSQEDAIRGIERNDWEFYMYRQGKIVNIVVGERDGEKYLKAACDADQPEFLLTLPELK
ncbi:MAG TPA: DUF3892 domain-containing protein [Cyclobacteriaceae bacterium]|nr:DUF3892 domain-containing protein [Cyclobacteriaceae bacterium]